MELESQRARPSWGLAVERDLPALLAAWSLPFGLLVYLGLRGGGYDPIVSGEVGIAIWWIILVGASTGALAVRDLGRWGWAAVWLLGALAAWSLLGLSWTESAERTSTEVARVATYLGVLVLALTAARRAGARALLSGLTAGIALVCAVALLSRLQPQWFPANDTAAFFPNAAGRLNFPFNYWNALAAFVALGLPLVLWRASAARSVPGGAAAAALLPVLGLTLFMTYSRGGVLAAGVGVVAFIALTPDRMPKLISALLGGAATAVLIGAASQRHALVEGKISAAAGEQGDEMLLNVLVVCLAVALLQTGARLLLRNHRRPPMPRLRTSSKRWRAVAAVAVVLGAVVLASSGWVSSNWDEFKRPEVSISNGADRLASSSGNGRYQYWQSAVDAFSQEPLTGVGAGTFEFWWARGGTLPGFVRDAHSLYFETLAELGIVGLILLLGLFGVVLARGVGRILNGPESSRPAVAATTAACLAFAVAAASDWVWELAALPVTFLLLAAVVLSPLKPPNVVDGATGRAGRLAVAALAIAALGVITIPLASGTALRQSQTDARAGRWPAALAQAKAAGGIEPYAASPRVQQALVEEARGRADRGLPAARAAVGRERTNWRTWLVLSRLEARRGNAEASVRAYRRARALNPRSSLFAR